MESTTRGRAAAAVDDVGDGRRFPDPLPPHGRDTDSTSADMSALVFRREQLLHELHRERIRHDMIMCELAETERVMTACLAGRGARCGRSLMTRWEEAMYRTSRSSEETSWWCRSPSEAAIAPVYPNVERSPSPVLQPKPVNNAEKQERGSSSRPLSVAPSAPHVEQCPSLRKRPAVEEALVPAAANVVAKPAQPALLSKEVTLERPVTVDHEHKTELKDRHVMQLMQSEIRKSEQLKRAAVDQEHEAEAKDTHVVQLMGCEIQRSEQPMHAAVGQECRAEAKDSHTAQLMECEIKRSQELKHAAAGQEHEAEEKYIHAVQLMDESGIQATEQPKPAEPTIKDRTDDERRQSPHQYALVGMEKSPPNEQKKLVFNELNTQITSSGVRQISGPLVETPPPKRHKPREDWTCTCCQVSLSCEEDLTQHQVGDLHRLNLATLQSRQEPTELTAKSTPESSYRAPRFNRMLVHPKLPNNLEKSEPQKAKWGSGFDTRNHLKHTSHQENTQALHTGEGWNHFKDRNHQRNTRSLNAEEGNKEGSKSAVGRTGSEDLRKKFVTNRKLLFCALCKVQCNSEKMMESHLGGKKHRENLQARH